MRTIAILPIKSFDAAKQRLSASLAGGSRHALAHAMFADVVASLRRSRRLEAIAVVTSDREAEASVRGERLVVLRDELRAGQSAAAMLGIDHARAAGFERVLLVPGDAPLVDAAAIDRLLERCAQDGLDVAIVPDRHGTGTNGLLISPPDALEPSFGPDSLERHLQAARAAGLTCRVEEVESLMHDVDTPEDLDALSALLEDRRGVAPRTRGALSQLHRIREPPPNGERSFAEPRASARAGEIARV